MEHARPCVLVLALMLSSGASSYPQSFALPTTPRTESPPLAAPDPFAWLEDLQGKRSLDWVRGHTAVTLAEFSAQSDYAALYTDIRRALEVRDTISYPQIVGDRIYNLSHDGHRRGLWRWTTWDRYVHNSTTWQKILDLDSLAIAEDVAWEYAGAECPDIDRRLCILELDHAGPGTPVFRAFDVDAGKFVDLDPNLALRRQIARVARSEMPNDEPELWRPPIADGDVYMVRDQVIVFLHRPLQIGKINWPPGCVVATSLADFVGAKRDLALVVAPGPRETIKSVAATRDYLIVNMLDNVRGEIRRYRHDNNRWVVDSVRVPAMGSVDVVSTSTSTNDFFFSYSNFLQPTTLYLANDDGSVRPLRRLPSTFDATKFVTEQAEAISSDGTKIPFFIVRPKEMSWDGSNPTLLYAYGGFELSSTPVYGTAVGPAWIARGGVYVVANVRGGGEFGSAWHEAGIKANRQRVFDDFIAVAAELIRLRVTSPAHLGIIGSSNGGLLAAVAFTQRPDLFKTAVVQSALLDMRAYTRLGGARWISEYGDPDRSDDWAYMAKYSPYDNLKPNTSYAAVMFETNMLDERVHPAHARKMAAKMESMGLPVHYFENMDGGHAGGLTADQKARTVALAYTFLWQRLRAPPASSVATGGQR